MPLRVGRQVNLSNNSSQLESVTETQVQCNRCGVCCRKGGPAFHLADKELLEKGLIQTANVYTIRKGEPIYDNVKDTTTTAETDIIKIKGSENSWACFYLNSEDNSCQVYETRPLECRSLKCWDTRDIENVYRVDRLERRDLVSGVEGLWQFIEDHQQDCSYQKISQLLESGQGKLEGEAKETVLEMIKYDLAVRPMIIKQGQLDPNLIDFLLGRPLIETIGLFGLDIQKKGNSYIFKTRKQAPYV